METGLPVGTLTNNTDRTQAVERELVIANPNGMHARPAAVFVKLAGRFSCEIDITKDGETVNGKSIIGLLSLAAKMGQRLIVTATGKDAEAAVDALHRLVENKFEMP